MARVWQIDKSVLVVAGFGIAIAITLFVGARNISPPMFDPVGSAALPIACAWALLGCTAGILFQAVTSKRRQDDHPAIRWATAMTALLMGLYILAMTMGLGFTYSTILFTAIAVPLVSGNRRSIVVGIGLALLMGYGAEWLFTSVFFVDLPRFR